jgi:hypothetical protein
MDIITEIQNLTNHKFIKLTTRGNAAIDSAVSICRGEGAILIPEEGGWLSYKKIKNHIEVKCKEALINLEDLETKLESGNIGAFLYQNPGGYFARQPMKEIYELCQKYGCMVIIDVSGSIGTELCIGQYADMMVGSFGKWKLVEAGVGGFISCKTKKVFKQLSVKEKDINQLDQQTLIKIESALKKLPSRISYLEERREKIINDLKELNIVHPKDKGLVVVVKFSTKEEREKIINYCKSNALEWTECPRYIRLNQPAISIEMKRLGVRL